MARKSPRSFRLSSETQKHLTLIAADLGINQTEALEVAVQDYYYRLKSEDVPPEARDEMEVRAFGPEEALARQWDGVADSIEADETLTPRLRESVSRLARSTARNLRGKAAE